MPDPHHPHDSHDHTDPPPPPASDPRLEIPEVLREKPGDREADGGIPPKHASGMVETAKAWGMALDLVFTTVGMFFLGYLFDRWRGTGPWGAIVGLVLGFVTAAVRLVRTSMRQQATANRTKTGRHG